MNIFPKKWFYLVLIPILALGGVSLWYLLRDSDEAQIRKTLDELCDIASKRENEKNAMAMLKLNSTDKIFAPECRIDFRHEMFSGTYTPAELTSLLARSRGVLKSCEVKIRDLAITVELPDKASAVFTGLLDATMNDGSRVNEVRELFCTFRKVEERWLIDSMSVRDILEK